jgi:hypothetical protein
MAKNYQTFQLKYNGNITEFITPLEDVTRKPFEVERSVITPNGSKYKQVFGLYYEWYFNYRFSERAAFDFFDNAYQAAINGYSLTLAEEQDDGSFTEYEVIMFRPEVTPHTLGTTGNFDRDLHVIISQARV